MMKMIMKSSKHKESIVQEMADLIGADGVALYASYQAEIKKISEDTQEAGVKIGEVARIEPFPPKSAGADLNEIANTVDDSVARIRELLQQESHQQVREIDEIVFSRMLLDYIKGPPLGASRFIRSPEDLYFMTKRIITAYATRDPHQAHYDVVSTFLAKWGADNEAPDLAENDKIRLLLAGELCRHAKLFKDKLIWPPGNEVSAINGTFCLDHEFAAHIEAIGPLGEEQAAKLRERANERYSKFQKTENHTSLWYFWFDEQEDEEGNLIGVRSRFAETLTRILWNDVVKSEWDRQRHDFPHMTHGTLSTILPALRPGNNVIVESMQNENVTKLVLYTSEGRIIAETSAIRAVATSAITMIRTGADILSSTLGIMLTVREVAGFWNRYYNSGKDWGNWSFTSYEDLCTTFQILPHKHRHEVRQILNAQANMSFTWPCGGKGSMIGLFEGQGPRRTIRPTISANYPITPNYSWDIERSMGDTRTARTARWKIPIPHPWEFPAVVGRRNEEAEQKVVYLVMLSKIAENARAGELVLTEKDWTHCANEAGVSPALATKTLHGWIAQGHLVKLPTGGWWLGDPQTRLADIIREGYVIADKGRHGIPPPRKLRNGTSRR